MDERSGVSPAATAAGQNGPADSGSGSADGPDSASGSQFAVGDRIRVVQFAPTPSLVGRHGEIIKTWDPLSKLWVASMDDYPVGYHHHFYSHEIEHEPVPYELTVEAEQALDGPWSGEPLADWEKELLRPEWEQQVSQFCFELGKLIIRKRRAYGTEAIDDGPWGWHVQLITRMHEKLARIVNLATGDEAGACIEDFEPLAETFMDLAGLSVLAWIKAKNEQ